jgi:hypothetical protein
LKDDFWYAPFFNSTRRNVEDDLNTFLDKLNFYVNGRGPQFIRKLKETTILLKMVDSLKKLEIEDDPRLNENGR